MHDCFATCIFLTDHHDTIRTVQTATATTAATATVRMVQFDSDRHIVRNTTIRIPTTSKRRIISK